MSTELIEGLSPPEVQSTDNVIEGLSPERQAKIEERARQLLAEELAAQEKPFVLSPYGEKLIATITRYIPVYERETGAFELPWDELTPQTKAMVASGFAMGLTCAYGTLRSIMLNPDNVEFTSVTPEGGDYDGSSGGDPGGSVEPSGS